MLQTVEQEINAKVIPFSTELRPGVFALWLFLFVAASFLPVLVGEASFFFRDFGFFSYPIAEYHRESFWRGEVPLWNPYNNLGIPFLAQWNTMVLYPLTAIYLLLPMPWSLNFFCLFHLWLGGMGMFYLARHWVGHTGGAAIAGFGFCFNGLVLSCLKWPNNIAALGWMPWVILSVTLLVDKRRSALPFAAGVGALQMMTGAVEIILLTWVFATVYVAAAAWKDRFGATKLIGAFAGVVLLISGLAAVQLLPFLQLLGASQRDASYAGAMWPMPIWGGANFLVPLFRTFSSYHRVAAQPDQYWISTYYLGLPVLIAALLAITRVKSGRVRMMTAVTVLLLWLALGDAGGLYAVARNIFPPLSVMRYPIKFVVLPVFCLCLLSAFGVAWLEQHQARRRESFFHVVLDEKRASIFVVRVGLVVLLLIIGITCYAPLWPHEHEGWATTLDNGLARAFYCLITTVVFFIWVRNGWEGVFTRRSLYFVGMMVLFLDVRSHAPWQNPTVVPDFFREEQIQFAEAPEPGKSRAMISPASMLRLDLQLVNDPEKDVARSRRFLYSNCNLIDAVPKVDGFYSLELKRTAEVLTKLYAKTDLHFPPLMRFLSVSQYTTSTRRFDWRAQTNWMSWITIGQQPIPLGERAKEKLFASEFAPEREVYLEQVIEGMPANRVPKARVSGMQFSAHKVSFQTVSAETTMVVHNQAWTKEWRAMIDGKEAKLERVNHAFQGVLVPAGEHLVVLEYRDWNFRVGAMISLVSLMVLAVLFYKERR